MTRRRRRVAPRWARALLWAGVGLGALLVAVPAVAILALRWIPPPASAFMMERAVGGWIRGDRDARVLYLWCGWERISPHAKLAVIAAEDQKFRAHDGFDREAIADAWQDRQQGKRQRGASTISQQVAKNLFLWPDRSFLRKGLEAWFTVLIEALWPKRRILEVYLNVAEFGQGTYGVRAAARRFFGKAPAELTREQASLLAAVLPSPRRLRVDRPSAYVRERAAWIRGQMEQLGGESHLEGL